MPVGWLTSVILPPTWPDYRANVADFGPWFWKLLQWFDAGRAVGFGEVNPLMREVAAVMMRDRDAAEAERMQAAVAEGVRRAMGRR